MLEESQAALDADVNTVGAAEVSSVLSWAKYLCMVAKMKLAGMPYQTGS